MTLSINDLEYQGIQLTDSIANGASVSSGIQVNGFELFACLVPAAWTAAALTLEASFDGVTWFAVFQGGTQLQVISAATMASNAGLWDVLQTMYNSSYTAYMFPYLRFRSGTTAVPVNQGALRNFTFLVIPNVNRKP